MLAFGSCASLACSPHICSMRPSAVRVTCGKHGHQSPVACSLELPCQAHDSRVFAPHQVSLSAQIFGGEVCAAFFFVLALFGMVVDKR